jgi:serine/threonine protein kinase
MASHPKKIGKYNVEGILGHGGMGVVYKAVDSQIGRYVAIKIITAGGDPSLLERFKSEARATGSLQCPNIVTVYDFGEQDGNPYLVMQFLEGSSLESMIQKRVSLSLSERIGIIIDVCNGLAYAHQRGVIHRDIKPGNIMVLQDGVNDGMAVIVDFGIARIGGDTGLTGIDKIIGSFHYMAAEQFLKEEVDNRTDVYATGVVLFQLLTGALPFDAPDTSAMMYQVVHEPPPPLSKYLKEYPIELEAIVNRALAKKRDERYANAKELAFDLMEVQEHLKSETVAQLLQRAEVSLRREDWTRAREHLQQVLRLDPQNTQAQKMMNSVQERLRQLQQIEQARGLRNQADEAYLDQRYDDALRLLEQAVALDGNNSDLQAFRESVQSAKERATGLRRALRRAEAALRDGDLDEAQSAVGEAFKIDPQDTQAKALKVIVSKQVDERSRQDELRRLLDQARNQLAARDLTGAFGTLKTAEALDPTSNELQSVLKMAISAREQERRRSETEELRREIEGALLQEDYAAAVAKAEEGLRKFPQEQSLGKLKSLAEAQRARVEQKKFIREQFAAASSLIDSGQVLQALGVLDRALQRAPGNSELEALRSTVRDQVAAEESERQKLQGIEAALAEGKRILQARGARSAREFLDTQASLYLEFPQVRELYDAVKARQALDDLDSRLALEPNPAKRVQWAEEALGSNPDNHWIRQRSADLQQVKAQISAAIDRAQNLEAAGSFSDALREWQQLRNAYPQVAEFELQIKRLVSLQERGKVVKVPAAKESALRPGPKPGKSAGSLFATRMPNAAAAGADVTRVKPTDVTAPITAAMAEKKAVTPSMASAVARKISAADVQRRVATFVSGPNKYVAIAVAAAVVLAAMSYLLIRGHKKAPREVPVAHIEIRITTSPPDASVTSDSTPVPNRTVSVIPGKSVAIEVARLGYKTKRVEVRQAGDGDIVLDPEPLHLSIQTAEKSGTVELDDHKIADLSDGNLDEYDLPTDGNEHVLIVRTRGKSLFTVELKATPGSLPNVNDPNVNNFSASGLFVITSLGNSAKVYAGDFLKNVQLGEKNVAVSSSGTELSIGEGTSELKFGETGNEGSVTIEMSNAPTLAVHSISVEGQILVTSNVEGAVLTVDGTSVKRKRRGWQVNRRPGTYKFVLSAEGYEPEKWTIDLLRHQSLIKNVDLTPKAKQITMSSLVIADGTPEAAVEIDGKPAGALDAKGRLELSNALAEGTHSLKLSKSFYEGRTFKISAKPPAEVRVTEASLVPWPMVMFKTDVQNVTVEYHLNDESQTHQIAASASIPLPPGLYNFVGTAPGFQGDPSNVKLVSGNVSIPLTLTPVTDYEFQDPAQVTHVGPWVKLNDASKVVYLKPGLLDVSLVFAKPGKKWLRNKKIEWAIEAKDGAGVQYEWDGQNLVRKLVKKEGSDQNATKLEGAAAAKDATSLSVHIQVEGSHVSVSNDKGVLLDGYTAPQHDFSGGRIRIKTDSQFKVTRK